jgi:uncharacterized membrane protein YdbT with pleckstrin-like domain
MAFPEDVLTADEKVVLHLHPHWKAMIRPVAILLVAIAAVVATLIWLDNEIITYIVSAAAALLAIVFVFWPWLVWRTTHYVITNERVLLQTGVFSRERRDIPLARVNDHSMSQKFIERLLGCGTLTIESAGERGQSVLTDIPDVEKVQTTLYELVEADRDAHSYNDDERRVPAQQAAPEAVEEKK